VRTVLLVPRRTDGGPRDRVWAWCRDRWTRYHPDWDVVEGHHEDGPFNRSAAVNRAADDAGDWDVGVVIDSDVFLRVSQAEAAVESARRTGLVTWGHRRWRGITEDWTRRIVADRRDFGPEVDREDMDVLVERTNPISWSCFIAFPRAVFDDMGGFDERFEGWGYEDMALQSLVVGLYGHERIEGDVYHLWHPRSEERIEKGRPATTSSREYAVNGMLGRRYMVALRRDHGLHDRPGLPASEEERQRDIANLLRDDDRLRRAGRHLDLPKWEKWWPTLEELRDEAKAYRADRARAGVGLTEITVVLHTGGSLETWSERSAYLRRSLDSLTDRVKGNIVQRVVYSDWPDEVRDELTDLVAPYGFYVVGDGHHGYTESMERMWRYIGKRAIAPYVFQTEDDFIFDRDVDLGDLAETMTACPWLAQVALLRDAYYQDERDLEPIGNILGWPEPAFTRQGYNGHYRLEHRLFFTANPSLFRRELTRAIPWPSATQARRVLGRRPDQAPSSETAFGKLLFRDPDVRVAFWGEGEQWVSHIGAVRAGIGY